MKLTLTQKERDLLSVLLINARDNAGNSLWIASGDLGELYNEDFDFGDTETQEVYSEAETTVAKLLKKFAIGETTKTHQLNQEVNFECPNCHKQFNNELELETLYKCGNCQEIYTDSNAYPDRDENYSTPCCWNNGFKFTEHGCPSCEECEVKRINQEAK